MPVVTLGLCDRIAIVTIDNPPVNVLSQAVRRGLLESVAAANRDAAVDGIVVRSAGPAFIAGADIREFERPLESPQTPEVVSGIEMSPKAVVAALHGSVLGGGLEVALACHRRIAERNTSIGFPEVNLGLIPGASGTQRLPRLTGFEHALELMITGKRFDADTALELGVVDRVVDGSERLLEAAVRETQDLLRQGTPLRRLRDAAVPPVEEGLFDRYRGRLADLAPDFPAAERILLSLENALTMPFDAAVAAERALFLACLRSKRSRGLRHAFLAERAAAKSPLARVPSPRSIACVGIVGAGTMGAGITLACVNAGLTVRIHDSDAGALRQGTRRIREALEHALNKGRISLSERAHRASRVEVAATLEELAATDLVIEAAYEDLEVKREIFARLDVVCGARTLLATNTSTLDVDAIATATARPADVLGLHFFSPAQIMRLIEIVRGRQTSTAAVHTAAAFAKQLGKIGVVVGNAFGFVGNRTYYAYGRESQLLLLEGAAPEDIDAALCAWGMTMGPHAVGDLAGLDVGLKVRQARKDAPRDPRYYRIATVLAEAGRHGQKVGKGMYRYEPGSRAPIPDPEVGALIAREAAALGIERRVVGGREIVERCIYALVIEGVRVLEAGIATRPGDIDTIWLNGYGFPRHRGGPMHYADSVGLNAVIDAAGRFAARYGGDDWAVPQLLLDLAASGGSLDALNRPRPAPGSR
jgi:3-hydroxyacyl-CoA dehydrogenase